jgi:uncharacterized protein (TIGR03083 family)
MALDRTWLLAAARDEREAMGRTIQYTEPPYWDEPSLSDGWRNRDVLAHLASCEVIAAATIAGEAMTEVAADLFLARCSNLPEDEWAGRRVYWIAGQLRVPYLLQSRVMEWWLHGEDIRAGADLEPRRVHRAIYCVNDLAIRTLPYALNLAGLSFPGRTVQVDLEGAGEGSWRYALAAGERPDADRPPDVYIEGRGYEFGLVAGRRLASDRALADGSLLVGGDVELGETVLRHLRAFA